MSWTERISKLHPRRQELIRPVLETPREFLSMSIRALADKVQSDTATTLRTIRGMGFSGYPEFRKYLQELAIANATSLDAMQSAASKDEKISNYTRGSLGQDQENLAGLRSGLDTQRLTALARRMWKARRIIVMGSDLAAYLAGYFEHHLGMLGLPVCAATYGGRIVSVVRSLNEKDLVFAISYHRGLRQTVEGLRRAKSKGAYCVGLADTYVSPIARFSDECFVASVKTLHFGDSYVAPMALLNVILLACANYQRDASLAILKEAALDQQTGFRWFEE